MIDLQTRELHAAHPLAHRIPWSIWAGEFQFKIHSKELRYMDMSLTDLHQCVQKKMKRPYQTLLSILLGHQEASDEALLEFLLLVSKNHHYDVLMALLVVKRTKTLELYLDKLSARIIPQTLKRFWMRTCVIAARYGDVSLMEYIASKLNEVEWLNALSNNHYEVYLEAASHGQTAFLHYLETHERPINRQVAIRVCNAQAFRAALSYGHLETVKHIDELLDTNFRNAALTFNNFAVLLQAAAKSHIPILEYVTQWLTPEQIKAMTAVNHFEAYRNAAANGHIETLRFLERWMDPEAVVTSILVNNFQAYRDAAANGCVDALQYLETYMTERQRKSAVIADFYQAYRKAALNGHLAVMQHLEPQINVEQKHALFCINEYEVFSAAVKHGNIAILEQLRIGLNSNYWFAATNAYDYEAYGLAAEAGDQLTLQSLERWITPEQKADMISSSNEDFNYYSPHMFAAKKGHLEVVRYLESQMTEEEILGNFQDSECNSYVLAGSSHHFHILDYFESYLSREQLIDIIRVRSWALYKEALTVGNLAFIKRMEKYMSHAEITAILTESSYEIYHLITGSENHALLQHCEQYLSQLHIQNVLRTRDFAIYRYALNHGNITIPYYFERFLLDTEIKQAIRLNRFAAFRDAVKAGNTGVTEYLQRFMSHAEMRLALNHHFKDKHYEHTPFMEWKSAATLGHLDMLEFLEGTIITYEEIKQEFMANNFELFINVAANNAVSTLEYFYEKMPDELMKAALAANKFKAYRDALKNKQNDSLRFLEYHMVPRQILTAIALEDDQSCFVAIKRPESAHFVEHVLKELRQKGQNQCVDVLLAKMYYRAAATGNLSVLRRLEHFMSRDRLEAVIRCIFGIDNFETVFNTEFSFGVLFSVVSQNDPDVLWHFLHYPAIVEWAVLHQDESGDALWAFLYERCEQWRYESALFSQEYPALEFTLDEVNTHLALRVLMGLINHNNAVSLDLARFLLGISSVAAQAHTAIRNEANALLRAAIRNQSQAIIDRLLEISPVRDLAEAHAFYMNDLADDTDLRRIAQDSESSMRRLTPIELNCISRLAAHYKNALASEASVLDALRQYLREYYEANPALIVLNGERLILPVTWHDFERLGLRGEYRIHALKAYYSNRAHTALRWLLKPNPWMAINASHAEGDREHGGRYSVFESYSKEIALFWTAVHDKNAAPTFGHTYVGRIEHFIAELALINRAHNWDKYRLVIQDNKRAKREQYDDLEGDKPACFPGTPSRLFQSVIGHPLMSRLSPELLDEELRDFARGHFSNCITSQNLREFQGIIDALTELEELDKDQEAVLRSMDVSSEAFAAFIAHLSEKYQKEWLACHTNYLKSRMEFRPGATFHVTLLWSLVDFSELLESHKKKTSTSTSSSGFFASSSGAASSSQSTCNDLSKRQRPDEDEEEQDLKRFRNS